MNRKKDINEPTQIKAVIDFLKTVKTISSITELAGISTINSNTLVLLNIAEPIKLKTGQVITINNINYPVLSVNYALNSFTITASNLVASQWHLAIDFKFGSRMEINQLLFIESKDADKKDIRFPFIWLFINEGREHDNPEYDYKTGLKIAFVHMSDKNWKAQQRLDNVIEPVLEPLRTLFLETIQSPYFARVFTWEFKKLSYTEYYRYFYGSSDKNEMVLTAPTDAIEIDLDVTFQNQY